MKDHAMNAVPSLRHPDHPVAPQFIARWSPRAFTTEAMSEADVLTILEAARWAPSASNNQPWRFVWALRGEPAFDAVMASLAPGNQLWAPQAAAVVVVASKTTVMRGGEVAANAWHAFDAGAAWAQLGLQAHLSGFHAHAMGGFDKAKLAVAINLPADHATHAVVVMGHLGAPETLAEAQQAREVPSQREPLAKIARHGSF